MAEIIWGPGSAAVPNLYGYIPNFGFNLFATLAFGVTFLAHTFWLVRHKHTRKMHGFMMLFCAWHTAVYALRLASYDSPFSHGLFVAQYVLNQSGTIWISLAFLLAITAGLRRSLPDARAALGLPTALPYVLMGYQLLVFVIAVIGAALWQRANQYIIEAQDVPYLPLGGKIVTLIGLGNQVGQLTLVQAVLTWIMIRLYQHLDSRPFSPWLAATLFLTVGMVWTTALYRVGTGAAGYVGPAAPTEALFGAFDFAPMWVAALVWAVSPFARFVPTEAHVRLHRGNVKSERRGSV